MDHKVDSAAYWLHSLTERDRRRMMDGRWNNQCLTHEDVARMQDECVRLTQGTYITNECGKRIVGDALEEILNRRRKEKENEMGIYRVFFVNKETIELQYDFAVANSREAATMKAAAECGITADEIENYEIRISIPHDNL